jgi:FkbM family methyltransferase
MSENNKISRLCHFRLRRSLYKNKKISQKDKYIFRQIKKGDICIDCGANIGLVSKSMLQKGAIVHAFEPDPFAHKVLIEKFSDISNMHIHNQAVSDKEGSLKLFFREEHDDDPTLYSVGSTLINEKNDIDNNKFCEVDVVRLLTFIDQFEYIKILKLDVEGAEIDILNDLLKSNVFQKIGLTLVETHEKWIPSQEPQLKDIKNALSKKGIDNVFLNWI